MGVTYNIPSIVKSGLVLCLDAANPKSYSGSGTSFLDISENVGNGTLTNGPTFSSLNGGHIVFDGTDDRISIPTTTLLRSGSTIISWCYVEDFSTGKASTGRTWVRNTGTNFTSMITFYNGGYAWESDTNSNPFELSGRTTPGVSASAISPGNWFQIAFTWSSDSYVGYVNSIQVDARAVSNNLTINAIGDGSGYSDSYPAFLKGGLSSLLIYNRELTSTEVRQNFNAHRDRFGI